MKLSTQLALATGIAVFVLIGTCGTTGDALEPLQEPITTGLNHPTAYTLNAGEWMLGGSLIYGLTDGLQIGTYPLLNLLLLNVFGKLQLAHVPAIRTDLALSSGFFLVSPLLSSVLPFLAPVNAVSVGGVASRKSSEKMTLHAGFNVITVNYSSVPLFSGSGPLFLGIDYKLSSAFRLLGSVSAFLSHISFGAGIMMRGLFGSTVRAGGATGINFGDVDGPLFFRFILNLFWRF